MGGGMIGAAGLMIPKMAGASTKYSVKCVTSYPAIAGGVASASSVWADTYPIASINNGDHIGQPAANMSWKDTTADVWGDWVEIDLNNFVTLDHVVVYTMQDGPTYSEPTDTMTFTQLGVTGFDVLCWNGGTWITVGSVTNNNLVKRRVDFSPFQTTKIRINITSGHHYSRIVEVAAYTTDTSASGGIPPFNAALAAPSPVVSGLDVVYPTLSQVTNAMNDFSNYSTNSITPIYNRLGRISPTTELSIVSTTNGVTSLAQTMGALVGVNVGTQDPNTALITANAANGSLYDPNTMMKAQAAALIPATVLIEMGFGFAYGSYILIAYAAAHYWTNTNLPPSQYWGWEGNASNLPAVATWGQIGGGGGPIHIPN